jgi:hypothetical protein
MIVLQIDVHGFLAVPTERQAPAADRLGWFYFITKLPFKAIGFFALKSYFFGFC